MKFEKKSVTFMSDGRWRIKGDLVDERAGSMPIDLKTPDPWVYVLVRPKEPTPNMEALSKKNFYIIADKLQNVGLAIAVYKCLRFKTLDNSDGKENVWRFMRDRAAMRVTDWLQEVEFDHMEFLRVVAGDACVVLNHYEIDAMAQEFDLPPTEAMEVWGICVRSLAWMVEAGFERNAIHDLAKW